MTKKISVSRGVRARVQAVLLAGTTLAVLSPAMPTMVRAVAAQSAERSISVSAGPLTPALNSLAAQTGLQVLFDASVAEGKTTAGASGTLTPEQALKAVLAGTGVDARFAGSNQLILSTGAAAGAGPEGATELEAITLYGSREATTLNDTIASVGIVNAKAIEDGQIRHTQDAYRRLAIDGGAAEKGFDRSFVAQNVRLGGKLDVEIVHDIHGR